MRFSSAQSERDQRRRAPTSLRSHRGDPRKAAPETRSPAPELVEVPQALPRGLWFRAFLQRATAAERVDLRGSELLPQDVETMWTTAARSDGRRRAMAGQAHRLLLVRPGRPRSCPLLWAAAAWLPVGCRWFVVFPLGGQKKWLITGPWFCPLPANQACSGGSGGFPPAQEEN